MSFFPLLSALTMLLLLLPLQQAYDTTAVAAAAANTAVTYRAVFLISPTAQNLTSANVTQKSAALNISSLNVSAIIEHTVLSLASTNPQALASLTLLPNQTGIQQITVAPQPLLTCTPGSTYNRASVCVACDACAGRVVLSQCSGFMDSQCASACPAGSFASAHVCTLCPAGTYSALPTAATACTLCPMGNVSIYAGSTACPACAPGTTTSRAGSTVCLKVPPYFLGHDLCCFSRQKSYICILNIVQSRGRYLLFCFALPSSIYYFKFPFSIHT